MNENDRPEPAGYLGLGGPAPGAGLDAAATLEYLRGLGIGGGDMGEARAAVAEGRDDRFAFRPEETRYCDFCFTALMGGEYDVLDDGRERCIRCSRSAVRTNGEFVELFRTVKRGYEAAFDVTVRAPRTVRMVSAKDVARNTGETFRPTPAVDARVLGYATKTGSGYELFLENGAPRLAAIATMAHELTHIWQYSAWEERAIVGHYGKGRRLEVYEGMATWAQLQYLLFVKEFGFAARQEAYTRQRDDEYGRGFAAYADRYPLGRDGAVPLDTPFRRPLPL